MQTAVNISEVRKTYHHRKNGDTLALENISLIIPQGSFFGLIGPNGAGKSTLIKILTGLSYYDSGTVSVFGYDVTKDYRKTRALIGVSPQEHAHDPYLTVKEELQLTGGYFGMDYPYLRKKVPELLEKFGLSEKSKSFTDKLSGGMKRRLSIAKALIHAPKILILDEPTAGLDLPLRHELWEILTELNKQGTTILLTTHYLEEAEHLCNAIAIIDKGLVVHSELNKPTNIRKNTRLEQLFLKMTGNDEKSN